MKISANNNLLLAGTRSQIRTCFQISQTQVLNQVLYYIHNQIGNQIWDGIQDLSWGQNGNQIWNQVQIKINENFKK